MRQTHVFKLRRNGQFLLDPRGKPAFVKVRVELEQYDFAPLFRMRQQAEALARSLGADSVQFFVTVH